MAALVARAAAGGRRMVQVAMVAAVGVLAVGGGVALLARVRRRDARCGRALRRSGSRRGGAETVAEAVTEAVP